MKNNITITIGTRNFTTSNDVVIANLQSFMQKCIDAGAVTECDIPDVSMEGISDGTSKKSPKAPAEAAGAKDTIVKFKLSEHKDGKKVHLIVNRDGWYTPAVCELSRRWLKAQDYIYQTPVTGSNGKQFPMYCIAKSNSKKLPESITITRDQILAYRAEVAAKKSGK